MSEPVPIGTLAVKAAGNLAHTELEDDGDRIVTSRCTDCRTVIKVPKWIKELGMQFHEILVNRGEEGMSGAGRCDGCGVAWKAAQKAKGYALLALAQYTWDRLNKLRREYKAGDVESDVIVRELGMLPDDFLEANALLLDSYRESLRQLWKRRQDTGAAVDTELE